MDESVSGGIAISERKGTVNVGWLKNLFGGSRASTAGSDLVDLRPESERKIERKAQSRVSPEDEEIARRMVSLIQQCQSLDDAAAQEMKKIGEQLCAHGGNERMLLIAYRVQALGRRVRDCELYWDGICGWMY
jgi:hypothetical protein